MTDPARPQGTDPTAPGRPQAAPEGEPLAGSLSGWAVPTPHPGVAPPAPPGPGGTPPTSTPGWGPLPAAPPPPPRDALRRPSRVDAVPGTQFGVVYLDVPAVTSGLAVGALVAGVVSILVSLLVLCVGVTGADWDGVWAAGAFTVLGALSGAGAVGAGLLGLRQIHRPLPPPAVRFSGRGLAWAGVGCGGAGMLFSLAGLGLALLVALP